VTRVAVPHPFNADWIQLFTVLYRNPDPAFYFNVDPNQAFHFHANPDSSSKGWKSATTGL
jgi:hypothetical protein